MSHLKKIGLMMMFFGFHHAWLHAATYILDPPHTSIGFSVKHLMITDVSDQFKTYEAKVELDEKTNELKWWRPTSGFPPSIQTMRSGTVI